jgi:fibronectin type 3 domain-containing protein
MTWAVAWDHSGRMKRVLPAIFSIAQIAALACLASCSSKPALSHHSVTLTWQSPAQNRGSAPLRYNIYRSDDAGRSYPQIASKVAETRYVDASVEAGRSYRYVVTSVDGVGRESVRSEQAEVTIP